MQEQELLELYNSTDGSVTDQTFYTHIGQYLFGNTKGDGTLYKYTVSVRVGNSAYPIRSFSENDQFQDCYCSIEDNPNIPWREVRDRAY